MTDRDFLSHAYAAARRAGLPDAQARLAATQAALESGFGKKAPGHNFFGVRAGKNWRGQTQQIKTTEERNGKRVSVTGTFRAYPSFEASFKDYKRVVERNWPAAMKAKNFPDAVKGLKNGQQGGYATASNYTTAVNSINQRLDKHQIPARFDRPDNFAYAGPAGQFAVPDGKPNINRRTPPDFSRLRAAAATPAPGSFAAYRAKAANAGSPPAQSNFARFTAAQRSRSPAPNPRTPGPGLAALAPNGLRYTHPERGPWDTGLDRYTRDATKRTIGAIGGGVLTSALRTPSENLSVGGARSSAHMRGKAVDMSTAGMSDAQKAKTVEMARLAGFNRLGTYPDGSLHFDTLTGYDPAAKPGAIKTADGTYGMYNRTATNAARRAPGWFTQGMTQDTVPTPTERPDPKALSNTRSRSPMVTTGPLGVQASPSTANMQEIDRRLSSAVSQRSFPSTTPNRSRSPAPGATATDGPVRTNPMVRDRMMPDGPMRTAPVSSFAEYRGRPASVASSVAQGVPQATQYAGRPASVAASVARSPSPAAPSRYTGRPSSVAGSVANGPSVTANSPARDPRDMQNVAGPTGRVAITPALNEAMQRRGLTFTSNGVYTPPAMPNNVATPVQSVPSIPQAPVSQPIAPVAPDIAPIAPVRTVSRPRIVAPPRVAPVRPRPIAPVMQPSMPVAPVAQVAPLSQGQFDARYNGITPGLKPGDVYNGAVGSALATGGNIVSRQNSWGPTTVTNKYGVTTATMPDGKQAAYKPDFGLSGMDNLGPKMRQGVGALAGAALGAIALGPAGGIVGGMLGRNIGRGISPLGTGALNSIFGHFPAAPASPAGQAMVTRSQGGLSGFLGGLFGGGNSSSSSSSANRSRSSVSSGNTGRGSGPNRARSGGLS